VAVRAWRQERQFGVSVGLVLLAIAAWLLWRGRGPAIVWTLGSIGAVLAVFGLAFPRALAGPNRAWMALAEALSWVSVRVILGLLFFLVFTPLGAWKRVRGWDPLNRRAAADRASFWHPYSPRQADPKHYERMF
jgi:thiol:disulfide interchange protein